MRQAITIQLRTQKEKDTMIYTLIFSQPVERTNLNEYDWLLDRFGVPQDVEIRFNDRGIFRNTELVWPEQPEQLPLPQ